MASIETDESTIRYLQENPEARMAAIADLLAKSREEELFKEKSSTPSDAVFTDKKGDAPQDKQ